jgi:hypothetical protein
MPHLGELAAWLIGSKKAQVELAKSGVACLRCGDAPGKGMAVLQWLVTPAWYGDRRPGANRATDCGTHSPVSPGTAAVGETGV